MCEFVCEFVCVDVILLVVIMVVGVNYACRVVLHDIVSVVL
jgi:hypothetical protein